MKDCEQLVLRGRVRESNSLPTTPAAPPNLSSTSDDYPCADSFHEPETQIGKFTAAAKVPSFWPSTNASKSLEGRMVHSPVDDRHFVYDMGRQIATPSGSKFRRRNKTENYADGEEVPHLFTIIQGLLLVNHPVRG